MPCACAPGCWPNGSGSVTAEPAEQACIRGAPSIVPRHGRGTTMTRHRQRLHADDRDPTQAGRSEGFAYQSTVLRSLKLFAHKGMPHFR